MSKPARFYAHEQLDSVEGDATEYIRGDIVEGIRQECRDEVERLQLEITQLLNRAVCLEAADAVATETGG